MNYRLDLNLGKHRNIFTKKYKSAALIKKARKAQERQEMINVKFKKK